MSKRQCSRCGRYHPDTAAHCPHCGPRRWTRLAFVSRWLNPGGRPRPAGNLRERIGVAVLIVLVVVAIRVSHPQAEREEQEAQARAQAATAAKAACRANAQCWGQRHWRAATVACKRLAQTRAKHTIRWPSGSPNPEFTAKAWADQTAGTLIYVGAADLQNGFGAWTPYRVGCLYGPGDGTATHVELIPGSQ